MSLLRSWRNILEPTSYKYSVPNGTGCVVTNPGQKAFRSCYAEIAEDEQRHFFQLSLARSTFR
jgi:hypothetical protein